MCKKVLALTNKYWIEDSQGNVLGFSKQKMFKLKEDIRIYTYKKKFKIVGAIWEVNILNMPSDFDRRVLLGGALSMAMIERRHK